MSGRSRAWGAKALRRGTGFLLLLGLVAAGSVYAAYGELEPCRVLAVENARRSNGLPQDAPPGTTPERWSRLITSQMGTDACAGALLDSWGARLAGN